MSGLADGRFTGLDVNGSGSASDSRNWKRGSGLWTWSSRDVVIEKSRFQNANGPGDSCGVHIDFNCRNVIVQYNFSAHNAGGFCEILGNNHNCAYRYNVSVNDGYRTWGVNGAMQEGKTFWLSGYVGNKKKEAGPFDTYFYNNTIFVSRDITAKFSISPTTRGLLIANNIFCIEGKSKTVKGDQIRFDADRFSLAENVVFENNLYLHSGSWPATCSIQDAAPRFGNPEFKNPGGDKLDDYIPQKVDLIKSRGIIVSKLPGDNTGLTGGLAMPHDILGRPIIGRPDIGAIETPHEDQPAGLR
jgi:hypothetical protein